MPNSSIPAWRPDAYARRRPLLLKRARIVAAVRDYFLGQDFVEVETPALQVSPGLEPHLRAFATTLEAPDGAASNLYLHTSPEFAMKKLLAAGEPRIFQMARVFRNGERSQTHHPEFTMLEWYRADEGYQQLMADCEALVRAASEAAGAERLAWRGRAADPQAPFERLTVSEAFRRHAGIDPLAFLTGPGRFDVEGFARAARGIGVTIAADDEWDAVFFKVFLDRVEPKLGHPVPTLLTDYPIHMAALSRPRADAPHLAERFELYVSGLELANAFGELTDPTEQRRRFQADMDLKQRLYGLRYPIDEDFLSALADMPEASGIALGLDRLVMLATGAERIDDVLWLPVAGERVMQQPRNIVRGILFMCAASAIFPIMNAMVKHLSADLPTAEIVWARNLSHLVFVTLIFAPRRGLRLAATQRLGSQILRSCFLLGSNVFYFTAMAFVPLAEASAISFISPFLVALIAAFILKERVGLGHWIAIGVGFLGALVIIRPGSGDLPWQAVFVLGSSICYSTYQVMTRGVAGDDSPETSVFYASMVGSVLTTLAVPFVWQTPSSPWQVVELTSLGVFGGLGHYCVARALMWGPAQVISPFQYVQLVAASLFGYFIFGDIPSIWTYVGAMIIIASGVSIALRARREERAEAKAALGKAEA